MRTIIIIILSLFYIPEIYTVTQSSSVGISFFSNLNSENDTLKVNSFIRIALSYVPILSRELSYNSLRIDKLKENIDSAEVIIRKKKLEFPSLLYLARAEYFFLKKQRSQSSVIQGFVFVPFVPSLCTLWFMDF